MGKKLNISDLQKQKATQEVVAFLVDQKSFMEKDASKKAKEIIQKCIDGWNRCPADFEKRVQKRLILMKGQSKGVKRTKFKSVSEKKDITPFINNICKKYSLTNSSEKTILRNSLKSYAQTFDIDNPADWDILENLLIDSLALTRINQDYIKGERDGKKLTASDSKNLELERGKIAARIMEWQKTLGVDRKSRDDELSKRAKDIASLAKSLDSKLDQLEKEEIEQLKEELRYDRERLAREPVNLPKNVEQMVRILENNEGEIDPNLQDVIDEKKERLVKKEFKIEKKQEIHELPEGGKIG